MRKLRVMFSVLGTGAPVIAAVALDGCGGTCIIPTSDATVDVATDADDDRSLTLFDASEMETEPPDAGQDLCNGFGRTTRIVDLPQAGTPADPGQICAVSMGPVTSNVAARITLTNYDPQKGTALGTIAFAQGIKSSGPPTITVVSSTQPTAKNLQIAFDNGLNNGWAFRVKWAAPLPSGPQRIVMKAAFNIPCDGGTQQVESTTNIDMCIDGDTWQWVSSGDACTVCEIIAEMAPSPIVSDNRGDDLPLGRVIRIRVIEIARGANGVLLLAENDAGVDAEYEWRVSGGEVHRVSDDVILWTPPEEGESFGQVAVWNDNGAVVENFLWGVA